MPGFVTVSTKRKESHSVRSPILTFFVLSFDFLAVQDSIKSPKTGKKEKLINLVLNESNELLNKFTKLQMPMFTSTDHSVKRRSWYLVLILVLVIYVCSMFGFMKYSGNYNTNLPPILNTIFTSEKRIEVKPVQETPITNTTFTFEKWVERKPAQDLPDFVQFVKYGKYLKNTKV